MTPRRPESEDAQQQGVPPKSTDRGIIDNGASTAQNTTSECRFDVELDLERRFGEINNILTVCLFFSHVRYAEFYERFLASRSQHAPGSWVLSFGRDGKRIKLNILFKHQIIMPGSTNRTLKFRSPNEAQEWEIVSGLWRKSLDTDGDSSERELVGSPMGEREFRQALDPSGILPFRVALARQRTAKTTSKPSCSFIPSTLVVSLLI